MNTHIFQSADELHSPGGGELPKEYSDTHDPFVALAAAAAVAKRIMLSTGICLVIARDPIVLAKEVAHYQQRAADLQQRRGVAPCVWQAGDRTRMNRLTIRLTTAPPPP
jgi:hypothetical protein